jgi:hypothetical protein
MIRGMALARRSLVLSLALCALPAMSRAQTPAAAPAAPAEAPTPTPTPTPAAEDDDPEARRWNDVSRCSFDDETFTDGFRACGYAETYVAHNFNEPSNGRTAARYYDGNHDTFTLQNVALTLAARRGPVRAHLVLQAGAFSESYGAPPRSVELDLLYRAIQELGVRWDTGVGGDGDREGLFLEGGLYVTPYTVEDMGVWQRWNWSASNLFAVSPFQVVGMRAGIGLSPNLTARVGFYNGWEQVVRDASGGKSVIVEFNWAHPTEDHFFTFAYQGGVERDRDDPAGPYYRHVLDLYGRYTVNRHLALQANVFAGFEPNRIGAQGWVGAALFARVRLTPWLRVAVRGDVLHEFLPAGSTNIFSDIAGAGTVASGTVTLDARPAEHLSLRVEYRHDEADGALFYAGQVARDAVTDEDLPTARAQDTLLLGLTAWF